MKLQLGRGVTERTTMNNNAKVVLWGSVIGAVSWLEDREMGVFQYAPDFLHSNIQLAPIMMPLRESPYEFPALARNTFRGLPGLLADSLPDKYGNAIIDAWLASKGRIASSLHAVERLCYVGNRGMGALEYKPAIIESSTQKRKIEVASLIDLANKILDERTRLGGAFSGVDDQEAINTILRVGTSAGGARAKAILAWNKKTNEFRSGQVEAKTGFEYWIMKFDGITSSSDTEVTTPKGYGKIEYAYHLMAVEAGIEMAPCCIHHEDGRSHFMTKRFDRSASGKKLHMQSLSAIAHYDYMQPENYSYEQAIQIMRRMGLSQKDLDQQVMRAIFNVVGRNCDDHVKNIAFIMNRRGTWKLSPAFDISYAWNPAGKWTGKHQMSINDKRDRFEREDLLALAKVAGTKKARADNIIQNIIEVVCRWAYFAEKAEVNYDHVKKIQNSHRTNL